MDRQSVARGCAPTCLLEAACVAHATTIKPVWGGGRMREKQGQAVYMSDRCSGPGHGRAGWGAQVRHYICNDLYTILSLRQS